MPWIGLGPGLSEERNGLPSQMGIPFRQSFFVPHLSTFSGQIRPCWGPKARSISHCNLPLTPFPGLAPHRARQVPSIACEMSWLTRYIPPAWIPLS